MKGIGHLRRKSPAVKRNDGIVGDRNQKENKTVANVFPFVLSQKEFDEEIQQKYNTNPELETQEAVLKIESLVMKGIYRYSHNQKD